MKFPFSSYLAALLLTGCAALRAADEKGVFDFSDLDVVEKPGGPKPAEPPAAAPTAAGLPEEAAALMNKLATYIRVKEAGLTAKILESRKATGDKLAARAAKAEGPGLEKLVDASLRCRKLPAGERLAHPVAATALPVSSTWALKGGKGQRTLEPGGSLTIGGQQRGNWFWVDETKGWAVYDWWGGDDCDLMRLNGGGADTLSNHGAAGQLIRVEKPEAKLALEAAGALATAAMQETQWRKFLDADFASKRSRVHDWLMEQARMTKGDPGTALLKEAAALEAKPAEATGRRESPGRVAGTWVSAKKRRFQFLPDGKVAVNGNTDAGTWVWAKVKNWNTMLVTLPGATAKEIFFARLATSEPGKLRLYAFGAPASVLTKQ